MQPLAQLIAGWRFQDRVSLLVGQPVRAANRAPDKARVLSHSFSVELNEYRMSKAIDARPKTADAITQTLRQHWHDAVRQINAVPARARFAVERAARFHVSGNIGNVHTEQPSVVAGLFDMNGVIEVARIIWIDGNNKCFPQIFPTLEFPRIDRLGNLICFVQDILRKFGGQMILPNDRQHIDAWRRGRPEHFDDVAFRINVSRFPGLETNHDFVANDGDFGNRRTRRNVDIHVVDESRIVRHNVIEIT